jgi:pimeloyl-ACP methyl ester carboxylesterase
MDDRILSYHERLVVALSEDLTMPKPTTRDAQQAIRPFTIDVPEADLADLGRRLATTRWPDELPGVGWSRGMPLGDVRELGEYWASGFDWRAQEAKLNGLPQFTTSVDGQPIHFIHARSPEPNALPLIISHGYPGSIVEFAEIIGPLTDPRQYGGDPADAFDVVAPSLPGFGFSVPVTEPGWAVTRMATAFAELMRRLGYERYGAQGGDVGAGVSGSLATVDPDHVVGVHVNSDPMAVAWVVDNMPIDRDKLSAANRGRLDEVMAIAGEGKGYIQLQSTRPQTIAYALTDSPAFQLAWIAEKFSEWTDLRHVLDGDAVDRDRLLTNVSIYWFTRSGASAARFLYESAHSGQEWGGPSKAPQGWALFAAEPFVREVIDPDHRIAHWSEFDRGGHFAAMETPDLLVDDIRTFFRPLR